MAAAPLLFDDPPAASPELALVDADLAAQLRGDLSTGGAFRPRPSWRPEYSFLVFDPVARDLVDGHPRVDVQREPLVSEDDEFPDYIVLGGDDASVGVLEDVVLTDDEPADVVFADAVVLTEVDIDPTVVGEAAADSAQVSSDYPILPDLGERGEALEETEAALRRIREQMVGAPTTRRRARVRRRFTVVAGLGAAAALALVVMDVKLGISYAPGWLTF